MCVGFVIGKLRNPYESVWLLLGKTGIQRIWMDESTVYPKKYAHGFVVLCFVVVMQSFIMNSHEVFIHIHQGCFAGTGAIVRLPQCQWSKPDGYGKISQCITTTKHSKAKTRVHISWDILYARMVEVFGACMYITWLKCKIYTLFIYSSGNHVRLRCT